MSKETPLKVSIRTTEIITTRLTRGRKASRAENVNDHSRLCIKCALKLKHGAVEKISYISSDNFIFKARKRNDYDSGKTLTDR
jgi:hypothetical protein